MRVFALPVVRTQYTSLGTFCSSFFKDIPCILSKFIHYKLSIVTYNLGAKDTSALSERTSDATKNRVWKIFGWIAYRFSELTGSVPSVHISVPVYARTRRDYWNVVIGDVSILRLVDSTKKGIQVYEWSCVMIHWISLTFVENEWSKWLSSISSFPYYWCLRFTITQHRQR